MSLWRRFCWRCQISLRQLSKWHILLRWSLKLRCKSQWCACVFVCVCPSECVLRRQKRPWPAGVPGADGAGVDPAGLPVAVRTAPPGVFLQRKEKEHKAPVQALPPQTGRHTLQTHTMTGVEQSNAKHCLFIYLFVMTSLCLTSFVQFVYWVYCDHFSIFWMLFTLNEEQ